MDKAHQNYISCKSCNGNGLKSQGVSKRKLQRYEAALAQLKKDQPFPSHIKKPTATLQICTTCDGTGLISTNETPQPDNQYPHVAIIGAGIGGVALALACLHRQIPFTLFERDRAFNDRSQGYGLTLQQASKEMKKFGITTLDQGIVSTLHLAHSSSGEVIGKWGLRNLSEQEKIAERNKNRSTNIHIARQSLRLALLDQLGGEKNIIWNHRLKGFSTNDKIELTFDVDGKEQLYQADILVGADGIRSAVRQQLIPENTNPLRYLGCIVILGICPLNQLESQKFDLLDGKTVFQTANGNERMYMMPYDTESVMWQFSFPIAEEEAKILSKNGATSLKNEVLKRTQWHAPIPQIIQATEESKITGYPVYDREILNPTHLDQAGPITIIGDAAHPMSPFKGQGANQALLDALQLAQKIKHVFHHLKNPVDIREDILKPFEEEMIKRSSVKVKKSAEAAQFLHSEIVLKEGNVTFGSKFNSNMS